MDSQQFELKNGNIFVLAEAAGGVYNGGQLRLICEVAEDVSAFLKITEDQRIGFTVPKEKIADVQAKLAKSGVLIKHYRSFSTLSPKACLGELCPKCEQDALGDAIEISPFLNEKFKSTFSTLNIGMNGCATACVASSTDEVHIVGDKDGYKIYIGGRSSEPPQIAQLAVEKVPRKKIGLAIADILDVYSKNKQDEERIADVLARIGMEAFAEVLAKHVAGASEVAEGEVPAAEGEVPAAEGEVPAAEGEVPAAEGEVPAAEGEVPAAEGEVPAAEGEVPAATEETEVPVTEELEPSPVLAEEGMGQEVSETELQPEPTVDVSADSAPLEESPAMESTEAPVEASSDVTADSPAEAENPSTEMKDLEIVDDLGGEQEQSAEEAKGDVLENPAPEPIDHGLEEVESETSETPPESAENSAPGEVSADEALNDDIGDASLDENVRVNDSGLRNKKTRIQIRGAHLSITLSDGSDFMIPFKSLEEGRIIEMEIEDETFLMETVDGKLCVKSGEFEMHVPLSHGSSSALEEEDEAGAAAA